MNSDDRDPPVPAPGEPDYLFTGEGPADADVARLESLLSPFAYRGPEGAPPTATPKGEAAARGPKAAEVRHGAAEAASRGRGEGGGPAGNGDALECVAGGGSELDVEAAEAAGAAAAGRAATAAAAERRGGPVPTFDDSEFESSRLDQPSRIPPLVAWIVGLIVLGASTLAYLADPTSPPSEDDFAPPPTTSPEGPRVPTPDAGPGLPGYFGVSALAGTPQVDDLPLSPADRLPVGSTLVTGADARARIDLAGRGRMDVAPSSRLRVLAGRADEQRFALDRGEIAALTWAPPRLLFIETPSAVAVDLGCAYTLKVDDDGHGLLSVTSGSVAFEVRGLESLVPKGASCVTRVGRGPGTPRFDDAAPALKEALERFDFGPKEAAAAEVESVVAAARKRDTLTLWHLLPRTEGEVRERVFNRAAALDPPPDGVAYPDLLALDKAALALWRESLRAQW